jgi:predicted kinase
MVDGPSRRANAGRLIVLCGLPGSGKTTIARQLVDDLDAIRLCSDEWMTSPDFDLHDHPPVLASRHGNNSSSRTCCALAAQ